MREGVSWRCGYVDKSEASRVPRRRRSAGVGLLFEVREQAWRIAREPAVAGMALGMALTGTKRFRGCLRVPPQVRKGL